MHRASPSGKRIARHGVLAAGTLLASGILVALQGPDSAGPWSIATAYVSIALLVAVLALGPLNVLRSRPNPVNTRVRRDLGIWAGITAVAHTALGLQSHMQGRYREYFLWPSADASPLPIRTDLFGLANYTGLAGTALFLVLTLISSDAALRRLGTPRWKRWQQLTYAAVVLSVAHGFVYQRLEDRTWPGIVTLGLAAAVMTVVQYAGWRRCRARDRSAGHGAALSSD